MRQLMFVKKLALSLIVVSAAYVVATTAHAQNARTWVSGIGTDTSNTLCSRAAPCLTFAHAIAETEAAGEINCLTPGDFGPVTISMPVTINCEVVSNGGIFVTSNSAITITTTSFAVTLIGLEINGGNGATAGVNIQSNAKVNIRNCKFYDFDGSAINFAPSSSGGVLVVDNVFIANTVTGITQSSQSGVANMTVRNSNINNNSNGISVGVSGGTHAGATIEQTTLAFNVNTALFVNGAGAVAVVGGSTVVNNGTGVGVGGGGVVYSAKNNQIYGNDVDGTPLTAYPGFSGGGA